MAKKKLDNIHPGEVLVEEFLVPQCSWDAGYRVVKGFAERRQAGRRAVVGLG